MIRAIYQEEDGEGKKGLKISKDLMQVGGEALKTNITTLGPLVLPVSEQLIFFATLVWGQLFGSSNGASRPYIPDYKLAFDHFCVYAPSKVVLDELQANMGLRDGDMEPSRATLHRFGNTSSSSIWYELAYLEAKGKVDRGDCLWQIVFGSGFKCNSAVRRVRMPARNPWLDCIHSYPRAL